MQRLSSKFKQLPRYNSHVISGLLLAGIVITSCATLKPQYGDKVAAPESVTKTTDKPLYQVFLVGDAGNADESLAMQNLNLLRTRLEAADSKSALLFLGDNIYPHGLPPEKNDPNRPLAEVKLQNQIDLAKGFKGYTAFIPGNHDWYSGLQGLRAQEKFVNEKLPHKKSFLPRNGCGIDTQNLGDNIRLIAIDSEWVLENWNQHKGINGDCTIKTREDFYEELESQMNKNQDKLIIVALHHPLLTNGTHGGQTSLKKQLFPIGNKVPVPVVGSLINFLRRTSGASYQDNQNPKYRAMADRLESILSDRRNVLFVSGHDHNLQYIERGNVKQIISGSGSKFEPARAIRDKDFSYGGNGYAILSVYPDTRTVIRYYANEEGKEKLMFEHLVTGPKEMVDVSQYAEPKEGTVTAQIYPDDWTIKSGVYRLLFGEHYRKYYSMPAEVPILDLTTYKGGLSPMRKGGGHQTNSIRFENPEGKQYTMRALRKSATRFLEGQVFKDRAPKDQFDETGIEKTILDFYTSAHPYMPFTIPELEKPLGIFHTNPHYFYVPKQAALGQFNEDFEEGVYMVEERPMKAFSDEKSFGKPEDIISSEDLLVNLRKNEKSRVDEKSYIRVRLFDMLIGDWDRHEDQWRWAQFTDGDGKLYRPIPRDRDQVFPKYGGALLSLLLKIPTMAQMQSFGPDLKNVKRFNWEPYPLDLAVLQGATESDWQEEAKYIQTHLTDEVIDNAFQNIPDNMKDETVAQIKGYLKERRAKLTNYADEYFRILSKTVPLYATDKDDKILITRLPEGKTRIEMSRLKKSGDETPYYDKTFDKKFTNEIWLYGLEGDDNIEVKGKASGPILIRLAGGNGVDTYTAEDGRKIRIYDFQNQKNDLSQAGNARVKLSDDYELNRYDYRKAHYNDLLILPSGGYNPDNGVKFGANFAYTVYGFKGDPYRSKHVFNGNYYFATNGYELSYTGDFAKVAGNWNLQLLGYYSGPTFTHNFFGFGNKTTNPEESLGKDFNRVRIQNIKIAPSLYRLGPANGRIAFKTAFEDIKVAKTTGRVTDVSPELDPNVFKHNQYGTAGVEFSYESYDISSLPSLGMTFSVGGDWVVNFTDTKKNFAVLSASLGFTQRITKNDVLVFNTLFKTKNIFSKKFEFFQAASIGGDDDIRGYRIDRFLGKNSFMQSSDLRLSLGKTHQLFIPLRYGILAGYDYGRVWMPGEHSRKFHQAAGGGVWFNAVEMFTGSVSYFYGSDGGRVAVGISLGL